MWTICRAVCIWRFPETESPGGRSRPCTRMQNEGISDGLQCNLGGDKNRPHPQVVAFLTGPREVWLPVIAWHELEFGLRLMPPGSRRDRLQATLWEFVAEYRNRILPLDRTGAEWAAQFRARARYSGRVLDLGDVLIAGDSQILRHACARSERRPVVLPRVNALGHRPGAAAGPRDCGARVLHTHGSASPAALADVGVMVPRGRGSMQWAGHSKSDDADPAGAGCRLHVGRPRPSSPAAGLLRLGAAAYPDG